ncbi:hypothetical protein IV203_005807 [Nitzschia inconspicua]|uniref:SET domain-containing protein n=1 Tax=Nitzschia inconspicua TaxID=303405 RepID=A0A9K3PGQ0_9STRA|nr:hypothetical protein IV203_005807 [Nitzschia inconspicua]
MKTDFAPFLSWCDAQGISTPLRLVGEGSYRSMRLPPTKEELMGQSTSPDGLVKVVQVPLDACIIGEDLPTLVEKLKYEVDKGDDSKYAPWLSLFPTLEGFQDMPRFWDPKRLDLVRKFDGGQLEGRMDIDKQRINQCNDPWALACVDSRSNFLPDETYSITPMLDMFNHDASYKTSARVDGGNRFMLELTQESIFGSTGNGNTMTTGDWTDQIFGFFKGASSPGEYQPGAEVFVSYGAFDSVETLTNYGFVSEKPNVCNIEQFKVRSLGMSGSGPAILIVDNEGTIDNLFNTMSLDALRKILATSEELEGYNGSGKISQRNEVEVFALIAGELEEAAYDSKMGVAEAESQNDALVAKYFRERQRTLEMGLKWLRNKFPEVF